MMVPRYRRRWADPQFRARSAGSARCGAVVVFFDAIAGPAAEASRGRARGPAESAIDRRPGVGARSRPSPRGLPSREGPARRHDREYRTRPSGPDDAPGGAGGPDPHGRGGGRGRLGGTPRRDGRRGRRRGPARRICGDDRRARAPRRRRVRPPPGRRHAIVDRQGAVPERVHPVPPWIATYPNVHSSVASPRPRPTDRRSSSRRGRKTAWR